MQTTQPTATASTIVLRGKSLHSKAMPHPEIGDTDSRFFWLRAYFQDQAQLEAIKAHLLPMYSLKRGDRVLRLALTSSEGHLKDQANRCLNNAILDGLLLFCHADTTVLQGGAA